MTLKDQTCDPNTLRAQYLENSWRCYLATIANHYLVCTIVRQYGRGYPIDSLASCLLLRETELNSELIEHWRPAHYAASVFHIYVVEIIFITGPRT